jgi:hypothetical protein
MAKWEKTSVRTAAAVPWCIGTGGLNICVYPWAVSLLVVVLILAMQTLITAGPKHKELPDPGTRAHFLSNFNTATKCSNICIHCNPIKTIPYKGYNSCGSSVNIATRLDDQGSTPRKDGCFFLCHHIQTSFRAHPTTYSISTRGSSPRNKVARVWSWPFTSI